MSTPTNYRLKIADTPTDGDEDPLPIDTTTEAEDAETPSPEVVSSAPPAPSGTENKRRGRRGRVQRVTTEEIDAEIERVNRLNGNIKPGIAPGTWQDE